MVVDTINVETVDPAAYRLEVRSWLAENLPQAWRADLPGYKHQTLPELYAWERQMYAAGYAGVAWPKIYGGQGLTIREHFLRRFVQGPKKKKIPGLLMVIKFGRALLIVRIIAYY